MISSSGSTYTVWESQREKRDRKGQREYFKKIMVSNFANLMKDTNINIQEAQQPPGKMNLKTPTLSHIITKLSKDKDRVAKMAE